MSETIKFFARQSAIIGNASQPTYHEDPSEIYDPTDLGHFFIYGDYYIPSEYWDRPIRSVQVYCCSPKNDAYFKVHNYALSKIIDFSSATWDNVKPILGTLTTERPYLSLPTIKFGSLGTSTVTSDYYSVYTTKSNRPPYIEVTFGDGMRDSSVTSLGTTSPASGSFVDRTAPALFVAPDIPWFVSRKLQIRKKEETAVQEFPAGNAENLTVQAGSIADGALYQYRWTGLNSEDGATFEGIWIDFTTVDASPSCVAISPDNTMVGDGQDVLFVWQHQNPTGSAQTMAELQFSNDGNTWGNSWGAYGSAQQLAISNNAFTPNTWYWRVRTYNTDGVPSEWSSAKSFVFVGPPATPVIQLVEAGPRPLLGWQTDEQAAYELTLDGEAITTYGTEKRWRPPYYLADGQHNVCVRVQNQYGRWSQAAQLDFAVSHTEGAKISLRVTGRDSAELVWSSAGYDFYVVYRDGKAIAKTETTVYTDLFAAGRVTYQVRGCYAAGYDYGMSNGVEVDILPPCPVLIDAESGETLALELSESQHRNFVWARQRQISTYHVAGRALPCVDVADYLDETLRGDVCFDDADDMRRFDRLLGHLVALKTMGGDCAVGILAATQKTAGVHLGTYTVSVTNIDIEEVVDLDA